MNERDDWTEREGGHFAHRDGMASIINGSWHGEKRWLLRVTGYDRPLAVHIDTPLFLMRFYAQTMPKKRSA